MSESNQLVPTSKIPRDSTLDGTLSLLREGCEFVGNRSWNLQSDIFATRLKGRRALCIVGLDAAAFFLRR